MDNFDCRKPILDTIRFAEAYPLYPELAKSPLLVGVLSPNGVLQMVSQSWSLALDCPIPELAGRRLVDFIEPDEVTHASAVLRGHEGTLGREPVSFALIGRNGVRHHYEWHCYLDDYDDAVFVLGTETSAPRGRISC